MNSNAYILLLEFDSPKNSQINKVTNRNIDRQAEHTKKYIYTKRNVHKTNRNLKCDRIKKCWRNIKINQPIGCNPTNKQTNVKENCSFFLSSSSFEFRFISRYYLFIIIQLNYCGMSKLSIVCLFVWIKKRMAERGRRWENCRKNI